LLGVVTRNLVPELEQSGSALRPFDSVCCGPVEADLPVQGLQGRPLVFGVGTEIQKENHE
jgi:hypothetical protein